MKLKRFQEFICEKYEFQEEPKKNRIDYFFKNKDNIKFVVSFWRYRNDRYDRDYRTIDNGWDFYKELNTGDGFGIIKTVTNITLDFIKKYQPEQINIEHIATKKEMKKFKSQIKENPNIELPKNKITTKRAIINKRFLERDIPSNYEYKLNGMLSTITKIS